MDERERPVERGHAPGTSTVAELRDINEQLLIAGLREQELATALEAERAQLAAVLAGIGDAVLVVGPAGAIVRTNAAYARVTGSSNAPLVPRDGQGRLFPQEETPQARAARGEAFNLESTLTATDGSRWWYEANEQPLHDHLTALVAMVIETAQDLPPGHTIHLDAGGEPIVVEGDVGRLEQVLLNLLTNSFTHAPSAAPVEVRLRLQGGEAALEVRDHGGGIAADQLPHLFARFYQIERGDRPSRGGLGLALFI